MADSKRDQLALTLLYTAPAFEAPVPLPVIGLLAALAEICQVAFVYLFPDGGFVPRRIWIALLPLFIWRPLMWIKVYLPHFLALRRSGAAAKISTISRRIPEIWQPFLVCLLSVSLISGNQLAVVGSTLASAIMFHPLRRRIQSIIDRRFYRSKHDAALALAAFSETLRHEVDIEQLSEQLVEVVQATIQPEHISPWLRQPERKKE